MGFKLIVRDRGRRDSLLFLIAAGVLGFLPALAFFTDPKTTRASLILGAILGLPLFALSVWRLTRMEALALSDDGKRLAVFRRTFWGRTRLDVPCTEVEWIGLGGHELGIGLKSGQKLELAVESFQKADSALRDLAHQLGIRYATGPDLD